MRNIVNYRLEFRTVPRWIEMRLLARSYLVGTRRFVVHRTIVGVKAVAAAGSLGTSPVSEKSHKPLTRSLVLQESVPSPPAPRL